MSILKMSMVLLSLAWGCHTSDNTTDTDIDKRIGLNKVRLTDLNEKPINLEQYKGKTVFINFWATWCKPCMEEMPSIEKAQTILQNKNVVFLMASTETADQTRDTRMQHPFNFNYTRIENLEELNVQALPTTFIFTPKGTLVFSETGSRNWAEISNIDLIQKINSQNE